MPEPQPKTLSGWRWLLGGVWAALRLRCPRCWKGKMFRGSVTMNDPCPEGGLIFQREEGYFLGAMYVSYLLSAAVMTVFYGLAVLLLPEWNGILQATLALIAYLPFIPAVFRYSRLLWVYFDRFGDFSDAGAPPYEQVRRGQPARGAPPVTGSRSSGPADTSSR